MHTAIGNVRQLRHKTASSDQKAAPMHKMVWNAEQRVIVSGRAVAKSTVIEQEAAVTELTAVAQLLQYSRAANRSQRSKKPQSITEPKSKAATWLDIRYL